MQAIIEAGGKQYRVQPGDTLRVASMAGDVGTEVDLGRVLAVFKGDGGVIAGANAGGAKVKATISANGRGKKVIVFKFKRKKQYKRTQGHRQDYTEVKIGDIVV